MIIFDLDGTLADCEHRRHFVKQPSRYFHVKENLYQHDETGRELLWKPDWKAFYEACGKDGLIIPVANAFCLFGNSNRHKEVEIWSGRCESVREKTIEWLYEMMPYHAPKQVWSDRLKMRPIGDNTPDDELKERWLDELTVKKVYTMSGCMELKKDWVDFVFDSDPKSIEMWRRRGIFVFNCSQNDEEF